MDNPFYTLSLQLAKLQESVDHLLAGEKSNQAKPIRSLDEDVTFTVNELATYLRCSRTTVDRYKKNNVIPYISAGRKILFKKSEVDKALASDQKKKGASK